MKSFLSFLKSKPAPVPLPKQSITIPSWETLAQYWRQDYIDTLNKEAAAKLASTGQFWKWRQTDGTYKIVIYSPAMKAFQRLDLDTLAWFIGKTVDVFDDSQPPRRFAGPMIPTLCRLIFYMLQNPAVKEASYRLQDEIRGI